MHAFGIPAWKKAPFLRLIIPLITGILLQWYGRFAWQQIVVTGVCFSIAFSAFRLLPLAARFKLQPLQGMLINIVLVALGLLITWQKDPRHNRQWYGNLLRDSDYIIATLTEPLTQKNRSYKANAAVEHIFHNGSLIPAKGNVVIYFERDSMDTIALQYGDRVIFNKGFQPIKNSGNPGAFDYRRYCAFQQIFHTVFLKRHEWVLLNGNNGNWFSRFLFNARKYILNILQKNMKGRDDQLAIAEALLIGYTQDLDKDLVQAYSNTGVVHIIAISGMHLGLIYVLLAWVFNKIPYIRRSKIIKVVFILSGLWLFALLTGGSASILRAAVMFTCIVTGQNLGRRSSIYNSLAASAFVLLCYNPYFLWDVGFQLSYLAVLSIVVFQKPIYHLLYVKYKWINKVWQITSVTLAAQLLTFPVCLFYFHQFPSLFLFTNILLVPLSSLVLFVEILLMAVAWIPFIGVYIGTLTWWLVWLMNKTILWFNGLPLSVIGGISVSVAGTLLLYGFVVTTGFWLLKKNKPALQLSFFLLLCFMSLTGFTRWKISRQKKMIVYNIPHYRSIDFINGNAYTFIGDTGMQKGGMPYNFHLKPARIALQLTQNLDSLPVMRRRNDLCFFLDKKILLIDRPVIFQPQQQKINVDCIIISKNPKLDLALLANVFSCGVFIFDGSNSLWKIAEWKKVCEQLHLRCYSVPEQGAFVLDL